jgi:hypothetical protein
MSLRGASAKPAPSHFLGSVLADSLDVRTEVLMRLSSHNITARRLVAGTVALTSAALAVSFLIAAAVSSVVRTGATAATATVTGGAAATGASAAALPDTTGSETVLAMSGVFLALCAAAVWALLRTSRRENHRTY